MTLGDLAKGIKSKLKDKDGHHHTHAPVETKLTPAADEQLLAPQEPTTRRRRHSLRRELSGKFSAALKGGSSKHNNTEKISPRQASAFQAPTPALASSPSLSSEEEEKHVTLGDAITISPSGEEVLVEPVVPPDTRSPRGGISPRSKPPAGAIPTFMRQPELVDTQIGRVGATTVPSSVVSTRGRGVSELESVEVVRSPRSTPTPSLAMPPMRDHAGEIDPLRAAFLVSSAVSVVTGVLFCVPVMYWLTHWVVVSPIFWTPPFLLATLVSAVVGTTMFVQDKEQMRHWHSCAAKIRSRAILQNQHPHIALVAATFLLMPPLPAFGLATVITKSLDLLAIFLRTELRPDLEGFQQVIGPALFARTILELMGLVTVLARFFDYGYVTTALALAAYVDYLYFRLLYDLAFRGNIRAMLGAVDNLVGRPIFPSSVYQVLEPHPVVGGVSSPPGEPVRTPQADPTLITLKKKVY